MTASDTAKFTMWTTVSSIGDRLVSQVPKAEMTALAVNDTSSRKPVVPTRPSAAALAFRNAVTVAEVLVVAGISTFHTALSAPCSAPKAPDAVSSSVPIPISTAHTPRASPIAPCAI